MPDVKISDLTDGTAVAAGDLVEIERPGSPNVSRRVPLGPLAGKSGVDNDDWSGTDLAVTNGGTGASSASAARSNLGLVIGTDVAAFSDTRITGAAQKWANLSDLASAATAFGNIKQNATTSATGVIEQAVASEFRADTAGNLALTPEAVWDAAEWVPLTDGTTISIALSNGFNFCGASQAPLALGGNRTLGAASSVKSGQSGLMAFTASGSTRTLTLNAAWLLMDGVETGPYSITTSQVLYLAYFTRAGLTFISGIFRRAA